MGKYKLILFDLDGTLTDPKEGITKSVQYALEKMNIYEPNLENLTKFIGPPLQVSFSEYCEFNEEQTKKAIAYYRERFKELGMYENKIYDGVLTLLQLLKSQNYILVIATSKPTVFAKEILSYFNMDIYFDQIVGSNLDGTRSAKGEIIQFILDQYTSYSKNQFIMVGDRKHDLIGANEVGIDSIGVAYGYGTTQELVNCNPTFIAESVEQLKEFLFNL